MDLMTLFFSFVLSFQAPHQNLLEYHDLASLCSGTGSIPETSHPSGLSTFSLYNVLPDLLHFPVWKKTKSTLTYFDQGTCLSFTFGRVPLEFLRLLVTTFAFTVFCIEIPVL